MDGVKTVAVLASGPSLNDDDIAYVRTARDDGRLSSVVAVSDVGLHKAPWADALVSHDSRWWRAHEKEALEFNGRRFSSRGYARTEWFKLKPAGVWTSVNSGLFAMYIARDIFEAQHIILLGFDLHRRNGAHFFGEHTAKADGGVLTNTDENKFDVHRRQFNAFTGAAVVNCTIGSDLKKFPIRPLRDIL